ncbi:hypothetical protein [Rhodococcus sp. ARC_M6]|nr:hypothetical protein [Rhodococcus sp. ARC_M6]
MTITLNPAKTGTDENREVVFAATRGELTELVESLQRHIAPPAK